MMGLYLMSLIILVKMYKFRETPQFDRRWTMSKKDIANQVWMRGFTTGLLVATVVLCIVHAFIYVL